MVFKVRKDTERPRTKTVAVNHDRQNMVGILAIKGEGKSNLAEAEFKEEVELGYTGVDLHAPLLGNMENAFWCIPKLGLIRDEKGKPVLDEDGDEQVDEKLLEKEILEFQENPLPFLRTRKAFKITLFASESLMFNQEAEDRYNDRLFDQETWYAVHKPRIIREVFGCVSVYKKIQEHFDLIYPQRKPKELWGKEMIRVVRLPFVNKNDESEQNKKAKEIVFAELQKCRDEGRIAVYQRNMFANEKQYFWHQELFIRNVKDYYKLYCRKQYPSEHGYTSETFPKKLKYWHKMVILTRELSELAPAKFKPDKSGESTTVKRSLLELGKTCRHTQIDWFADWQRYNDVDGQVRGQFDDFFIKAWNEELAGDLDFFFKRVDAEREKNKMNYSKTKSKVLNKSFYPDPHVLEKKYFYGFYDRHTIKLFEVPNNIHQHKEPEMEFHEMTGILYWHDDKKIPTQAKGGTRTVNKSVQQSLFNAIEANLFDKSKKKTSWQYRLDVLAKMQKERKLEYPQDLSTKDPNWLSATYSKLKKKFQVKEA